MPAAEEVNVSGCTINAQIGSQTWPALIERQLYIVAAAYLVSELFQEPDNAPLPMALKHGPHVLHGSLLRQNKSMGNLCTTKYRR